jgi:SAM-dependent methyltransferase
MSDSVTAVSGAEVQDQVTQEWIDDRLPRAFSGAHQELVALQRATMGAIIEEARIQPGDRVIDIGCGSGIPTLAIAELVGPKGHVTATDPSPVMIDAVRRNAAELKLENVEPVLASAAGLPFAEGTFDAATCHFGAMFFPDLQAALRRIRAVLRPGARAAFAAWGPAAENTLFGTSGAVVAAYFPPPPPIAGDPAAFPHPMRFAESGSLSSALQEAGFVDVRESSPTVEMVWPGEPESLQRFWMELRNANETLAPDQRDALAADLLAALEPLVTGGGIRFTARVVIGSGEA